MRGILFGLLLSNIVYLTWNMVAPGLRPEPQALSEGGARGESVRLLRELDAGQLLPYANLVADESPEYCAQIGPFRDLRDAEDFIATYAHGMILRLGEREVPVAPNYRVYLPPFDSRELAASALQNLLSIFAENDIAIETYLVPGGELANSIALGLFSEHGNALNVQRQMEALDYDVVVRTEPKLRREVWLYTRGFASESEFQNQWLEMRVSRSYVNTEEKLCETIAHTP